MRILGIEEKFTFKLQQEWIQTQPPRSRFWFQCKRAWLFLCALLLVSTIYLLIGFPLIHAPLLFFANWPGEYLSFYGYASLLITSYGILLFFIIPSNYKASRSDKKNIYPQLSRAPHTTKERLKNFRFILRHGLLTLPLISAFSAVFWGFFEQPTFTSSCLIFASTLLVSMLISGFQIALVGLISRLHPIILFVGFSMQLLFFLLLVFAALGNPSLEFLEFIRPIYPPLSITEATGLSLKHSHPLHFTILALIPFGIYAFWKHIQQEPVKKSEALDPFIPSSEEELRESFRDQLTTTPAAVGSSWQQSDRSNENKETSTLPFNNLIFRFLEIKRHSSLSMAFLVASCTTLLLQSHLWEMGLTSLTLSFLSVGLRFIAFGLILANFLLALFPLISECPLSCVHIGPGRCAFHTSFYPLSYRKEIRNLLRFSISKILLSFALLLLSAELYYSIQEPSQLLNPWHHLRLLFTALTATLWLGTSSLLKVGKGSSLSELSFFFGLLGFMIATCHFLGPFVETSRFFDPSKPLIEWPTRVVFLIFPLAISALAIRSFPSSKRKSSASQANFGIQ